MPTSRTSIDTPNASRYLQQLCKHWSHKHAVTFDTCSGLIDFGHSKCSLEAAGSILKLELSAHEASRLNHMEGVIATHLQRFARQESLSVDWALA